MRTDTGEAVAGSAEFFPGDGSTEYVGEIVVDSETLLYRTDARSARFYGEFGARLVPTMSAPGIACTPLVTPLHGTGRASRRSPQQLEWLASTPGLRRLAKDASVTPGQTDGSRVLPGRAVQTGGSDIAVRIYGVLKPRTVTRATFYRHLRNIQSVRVP